MRVRRAIVVILLTLVLASCGSGKDDDAPGVSGDHPPSGTADPPSCEGVLHDPFFEGEAQVVVGVTPGGSKPVTCSINLRGDSKVLKKLGIKSLCELPEASVVAITVDVEQQAWTYDRARTRQLDNGECIAFEGS